MIPKKANSLYKKITSEFEVSEDLVNKLVENYLCSLLMQDKYVLPSPLLESTRHTKRKMKQIFFILLKYLINRSK